MYIDIVNVIYYIIIALAIFYIVPLLVCIIMNEKYNYEVDLDNYPQVIATFFIVIGLFIGSIFESIINLFKRKK